MVSESRLGRILVLTSVTAYSIAAITDLVLSVSSAVDTRHALGAACVMGIGIALTLYFGREQDFIGGPLFKGQSALMGFLSGLWITLVLATAGGLFPLVGQVNFISFMGYVGSIAFVPPILASVAVVMLDRIRGTNRK